MSPSIRTENLGIRFRFDRQQRPVTPTLARIRGRCTESWALRGLDLEIDPGESVALIGANGAGKTTLLRTIARVFVPDEGTIAINGRIGSLLSTDAGLLARLTGRENALLLGVLAGLSRTQARAALPGIQADSRLGDAFARPVSSYSQGMRARLGFAVVERAQPEIMLLDEVHEALDHEFRELVESRARAVLEAGGIVVAAGHDHRELERLCDRALLLADGGIRADGPAAEVIDLYVGGDRIPR